MWRFSFIFLFAISISCTECPPCPCQDEAAQANKDGPSKGTDSKEELRDSGVPAAAMGGTPQKVTSYDLHGRAGFDKVNIWEIPDMDTPRIGYLKKGQRMMVGDPKFSSESCPKGWFELDTGGFVCQGRGMLVGTKPRFIPRPPPEGNWDELEPYRHGFIRRDWTPAYKRMPTEEGHLWQPPEREMEDSDEAADGGPPELETVPHDEEELDGGVNYYKYTKRRFRNVVQMLSRGFWVAVGNRTFDESLHKFYYETIKGHFVPAENVHLIRPPTFKGYEVTGETPLPGAIVSDRHASFFALRNNKFRGIGPVDRLMSYRVLDIMESGKIPYYRIERDRWLKSKQVAFFDLVAPPEGVGAEEKWIRVDLTHQTLVAYDGTQPVYATLVSTGLPESEETVTPRGKFRIRFKHLSDDMAGTVGDDDAYSVEDVPWVQYIHNNVAFHSSFWHSSYGNPKSHGCINLSPADARWLFNWTLPALPKGWHAVAATEKNPGTLVIIEGKTPE